MPSGQPRGAHGMGPAQMCPRAIASMIVAGSRGPYPEYASATAAGRGCSMGAGWPTLRLFRSWGSPAEVRLGGRRVSAMHRT